MLLYWRPPGLVSHGFFPPWKPWCETPRSHLSPFQGIAIYWCFALEFQGTACGRQMEMRWGKISIIIEVIESNRGARKVGTNYETCHHPHVQMAAPLSESVNTFTLYTTTWPQQTRVLHAAFNMRLQVNHFHCLPFWVFYLQEVSTS